MTREVMRYKLNELRMMLNDGEHTEEQGILVEIIKELDKVENKGEWIEHKTKNGTVVALTCPKCLKSPKNAIRSDFCPNCGADMRGGEEE